MLNAEKEEPQKVRAPVPELSLLVLLFFLHFAWEMLQTPFFLDVPQRAHWPATVACLRATIADVGIGVLAFAIAAMQMRDRSWFSYPTRTAICAYFGVGLLLTLALEWHAIHVADRWAYAPLMPIVPGLGVGLVPVMQWVIIPACALVVLRRLYAGATPD